jgi:hypothetical protein
VSDNVHNLFQSQSVEARNREVFAREIEVPFFVDWLTLEQDFDFDVPEYCGGIVQASDVNGEIEWLTVQHSRVFGSYDTSLRIRSHGNRVTFSGNVSRFGRPDNVFGFDLGQCLQRVNAVLRRIGLPPFTMGQKFYAHVKTQDGMKLVAKWTGCRLTRIDLTRNYCTGSAANARAYLEFLATQQATARIKVGTHGDGETVDWGRGSRRVYAKAYIKAHELARHGGPDQLIEWCNEVGLVRFELTVKATQLHTMGCNYLGGLDMGQLVELFQDRATVLTRAEHSHDDLQELPSHLRSTARDWLAGDDVLSAMSRATFFRKRKALLPYGIDIAVRRNVVNFKPRVRVIELQPAARPLWYVLDYERLAA